MELIYTRNWPVSSTALKLTKLNRLREELANSLNSRVGTVPGDPPLSELHGRELTARLSISVTSKGLLHVTYTEEPTPSS